MIDGSWATSRLCLVTCLLDAVGGNELSVVLVKLLERVCVLFCACLSVLESLHCFFVCGTGEGEGSDTDFLNGFAGGVVGAFGFLELCSPVGYPALETSFLSSASVA